MRYLNLLSRIIDILIAIIVLTLTSPLLIIISLLIWISDRGPIFADNSERLGRYGKPFRMFKFRSMVMNAHNLIQSDAKLSQLKKEWVKKDKLRIIDDPRVTTIGKFIRKFDIDELAQFLNVLKGDMSIVGPRPWFEPEIKRNLDKYPTFKRKFYDIILSIKPGITGLWQVSGRNLNTIPKRFELDIEYVKRKSVFFDLGIIFKTPFVILKQIFKGEEYAK